MPNGTTHHDVGASPGVPSGRGVPLMCSGKFGTDHSTSVSDTSPGRQIIDRELGLEGMFSRLRQQRIISQVRFIMY
jgi:hypothetical protein